MSKRIVFISFGGPTPAYHHRVNLVCEQMKQAFPTIPIETCAFTDADLKKDSEFWKRHGRFIEQQSPQYLLHQTSRGYGYWLWKPYLIHKTLQSLNTNDILIYADAGCTINPDGYERFQEYLHMLEVSPFGMIAFQLEHPEIKYTKRLLLEYCETPINDMKTGQFMATVVMLRKTPHTSTFASNWYSIASMYGHINDMRHPTKDEYKMFIDHRHDQSVYSLLVKQALSKSTTTANQNPNKNQQNIPGPITLPDETFFHPNWREKGSKFPIWATRIRY